VALIRVMTFSEGRAGRGEFRLLYEAFRGRNPEKISKDERRHAADAQRALEYISEPVGDLPDEADLDIRMRRLSGDLRDLRLPQRAYEWLLSAVEDTPFQAGVSAQVEALRDRLGAAEKIEEGGAELAIVKKTKKA
jgi:hypothetical protein